MELFIVGNQPADASAALGWTCIGFAGICTVAVLTGQAEARDCALALAACLSGMLMGWMLLQGPRQRLGGISGDLVGYSLEISELCSCYLLLFVLGHA